MKELVALAAIPSTKVRPFYWIWKKLEAAYNPSTTPVSKGELLQALRVAHQSGFVYKNAGGYVLTPAGGKRIYLLISGLGNDLSVDEMYLILVIGLSIIDGSLKLPNETRDFIRSKMQEGINYKKPSEQSLID